MSVSPKTRRQLEIELTFANEGPLRETKVAKYEEHPVDGELNTSCWLCSFISPWSKALKKQTFPSLRFVPSNVTDPKSAPQRCWNCILAYSAEKS